MFAAAQAAKKDIMANTNWGKVFAAAQAAKKSYT